MIFMELDELKNILFVMGFYFVCFIINIIERHFHQFLIIHAYITIPNMIIINASIIMDLRIYPLLRVF